MDPDVYREYSAAVVAALSRHSDVAGIVATGSMAAVSHDPDSWSDHDFWVITERGRAAALRADASWLPDAAAIALAFPETTHGVKVLYDDGHLVEFAVFDEDELEVARVNDFRVLLDRGGLAARIDALRAATVAGRDAAAPGDDWLIGQFLTHLVVGAGRAARGEHASGHDFVKRQAVERLLVLAHRHLAGEDDATDDLDPRRRVEWVFPRFGTALDGAMLLPVAAAAIALLDLAETEIAPLIDWPVRAAAATRRLLERATGSGNPDP